MKNGYHLLKGVFAPDEAKEILLSLINYKITFHQRKSFSQQERFGTKNPNDTERIRELLETRQELAGLIDLADSTGCRLQVHSTIEIVLVADNSPEVTTFPFTDK